jgi:hypothetical protein
MMSYDYSTCIERQHPLIMEAQCNILFGFAFTLRAVLAGQTSTSFGIQRGSQRSKFGSVVGVDFNA